MCITIHKQQVRYAYAGIFCKLNVMKVWSFALPEIVIRTQWHTYTPHNVDQSCLSVQKG